MERIKMLDCTLRDGGYVNEWKFGHENIKKMIAKLIAANMDVIECGFLTQKVEYDEETSKFNTIDEIIDVLPKNIGNTLPVCMINFGEYNIDDIPEYHWDVKVGIRVAFHKKDREDALNYCSELIKKGYIVFMQPMVTISYTDEEYLQLIKKANKIKPYAFYIVDSFGVMHNNDLIRLFYLVEHNLDEEISIGYHSHNNIQMAFSNSQILTEAKTNRTVIIDSSVFGMGRGAGNLNTELFAEYMNNNTDSEYDITYLIQIIDEVLNNIYNEKYWGYSLPHYVSAKNNCHPNYATVLYDKYTLSIENINEILSMLTQDEKNSFSKARIEELYNQYQSHKIDDIKARKQLDKAFAGKEVVLIAPGKSIEEETDKINAVIEKEDIVTVAVNFIPDLYSCDYVFVSNKRRYQDLGESSAVKIVTSNVKNEQNGEVIIDYMSLLNTQEGVKDNSGLMLIKMLTQLGAKKVYVCGIDGYSHESQENYVDDKLSMHKMDKSIDMTNAGIGKAMTKFANSIDLEFVTETKYYKVNK